jgi:hypothetical protein
VLLLLLLLLSASPGELLWVRDTPLSGWWWLSLLLHLCRLLPGRAPAARNLILLLTNLHT